MSQSTSWTRNGTCWISNHPQNTPEWESVGFGRITAYWFSACSGISRFKTTDQAIEKALGIAPPHEENALMKRGKLYEPYLVEWFGKWANVNCVTVGRAVPTWDHDIGASADALIGDDEILEVKVSDNVYPPLLKYLQDFSLGVATPGYGHIYNDHYIQMQGTMAVYGRKVANYLNYGAISTQFFHQKVPFDESIWSVQLYAPVKLAVAEMKRRAVELGIDLSRRVDPPKSD